MKNACILEKFFPGAILEAIPSNLSLIIVEWSNILKINLNNVIWPWRSSSWPWNLIVVVSLLYPCQNVHINKTRGGCLTWSCNLVFGDYILYSIFDLDPKPRSQWAINRGIHSRINTENMFYVRLFLHFIPIYRNIIARAI